MPNFRLRFATGFVSLQDKPYPHFFVNKMMKDLEFYDATVSFPDPSDRIITVFINSEMKILDVKTIINEYIRDIENKLPMKIMVSLVGIQETNL